MTYEANLNALLVALADDYSDWSGKASINNIPAPEFIVESGRMYDKIMKVDRAQKCAVGFVCKKDNPKKGFTTGDLLMAASYSAPATNFARGNIFELEEAVARGMVRWCGIG